MATALVEGRRRRPLFGWNAKELVREWTGELPPRGRIEVYFQEDGILRQESVKHFDDLHRGELPSVFMVMVVSRGNGRQPWLRFGGMWGRKFRVQSVRTVRGRHILELTYLDADGVTHTISDSDLLLRDVLAEVQFARCA